MPTVCSLVVEVAPRESDTKRDRFHVTLETNIHQPLTNECSDHDLKVPMKISLRWTENEEFIP